MKLLTKEIIKKIPKLYSTENIPLPEKKSFANFSIHAKQVLGTLLKAKRKKAFNFLWTSWICMKKNLDFSLLMNFK